MKRICTLTLFACLMTAVSAVRVEASSTATGTVNVSSPTGQLFPSSIHYVATATTTCAKGISAMGIYTAPYKLAYVVKGAKLDTVVHLSPGKYDTVVQEWDNCRSAAKTHVAVMVQNATTALALETANNTSAASSFQTQSNGNLGASNVSKVDIHTLLYPAATTEIYAELQPWFGDKRHMSVGYISWDPTQVDNQLNDMLTRGVTGVVIDWYGPADRTEPTTLAWLAAAANHPGFKVMIMIATLNGAPLITQFDLDKNYSPDWNAIQTATSPNIAWIFQGSAGFTHPVTSGSYSWMHATSTVYGMDYLTKFYNASMQAPQEMAWGAGYKGFNDTLASWTLDRIVGQQCGQTWLQTFSEINSY